MKRQIELLDRTFVNKMAGMTDEPDMVKMPIFAECLNCHSFWPKEHFKFCGCCGTKLPVIKILECVGVENDKR